MKSTAPESILLTYCFPIHLFPLLFSNLLFQKPKNTLLHFLFASFILCSCAIYLSNLLQSNLSFYRGEIDNLSYTSGCKYLFFVCRCCLRSGGDPPTGSIPWFHNWGKYLPSLCCIIPSSLGKYRRSLKPRQRNFWRRCRGGSGLFYVPISAAKETSSTSIRFLIKNLISLQLHYLPFASRFPLPQFTQFAVLFALFFVFLFLVRSLACLQSCLRSHDDSRKYQVVWFFQY